MKKSTKLLLSISILILMALAAFAEVTPIMRKAEIGRVETVKESVKCVFANSNTEQECYSEKGRCKGVENCVVEVEGPKGQRLVWKSTCGGYAYTVIDGENEYAEFKCAARAVPVTAVPEQTKAIPVAIPVEPIPVPSCNEKCERTHKECVEKCAGITTAATDVDKCKRGCELELKKCYETCQPRPIQPFIQPELPKLEITCEQQCANRREEYYGKCKEEAFKATAVGASVEERLKVCRAESEKIYQACIEACPKILVPEYRPPTIKARDECYENFRSCWQKAFEMMIDCGKRFEGCLGCEQPPVQACEVTCEQQCGIDYKRCVATMQQQAPTTIAAIAPTKVCDERVIDCLHLCIQRPEIVAPQPPTITAPSQEGRPGAPSAVPSAVPSEARAVPVTREAEKVGFWERLKKLFIG